MEFYKNDIVWWPKTESQRGVFCGVRFKVQSKPFNGSVEAVLLDDIPSSSYYAGLEVTLELKGLTLHKPKQNHLPDWW